MVCLKCILERSLEVMLRISFKQAKHNEEVRTLIINLSVLVS